MPTPLLIVVPVISMGALAALDAGLRRAGVYPSSPTDWLAGWRPVRAARRELTPYREGAARAWVLAIEPGIPRAVSLFLPPVFAIVLLWSLATVLALGDFPDVARGARSLSFVLASLSLCVVRALAGGATLLAALARRHRLFAVASVLSVALDATLACVALPCSDTRADDVRMALAGLAAQAPLILGFAVSLWWRRGLRFTADASLPPDA